MERIINHFTDDDLYKFTMCCAVIDNFPRAQVKYRFTDRDHTVYPPGFADELQEQIILLEDVVITDEEIAFMKRRCSYIPGWFYTYLKGYRFCREWVTVRQDEEGYLSVEFEGSWADTILLEVKVLAIISELYYRMTGEDGRFDYEDYYREHPLYPSSYPAVINQLGNDQLTWETAYTFDFGMDMGFLNDRIRLNADYYRRRNSDLIMSVAAGIGVGAQYRNVGEMLNQGVELTLNTHTLKSQDFNWYTTFTFSYNKNKLTKLYDGYFVNGEGRTFYEGDNIDMLKKVKVTGVDKETGKPIYERVNEDGSIEQVNTLTAATSGNGELSYQDVGLKRAPYYGGFTNTFQYKNFELYVHMTYSFGYKAYSYLKTSYTDGTAWLYSNMYKIPSGLKIWREPGDDADIPMVNSDPSYTQNLYGTTSFGYINSGHVRFSKIRLAYNFPERWLRQLRIQNLALSFTCDNVGVITSRNFIGADPENLGDWPAPRRYVFGLNFTF